MHTIAPVLVTTQSIRTPRSSPSIAAGAATAATVAPITTPVTMPSKNRVTRPSMLSAKHIGAFAYEAKNRWAGKRFQTETLPAFGPPCVLGYEPAYDVGETVHCTGFALGHPPEPVQALTVRKDRPRGPSDLSVCAVDGHGLFPPLLDGSFSSGEASHQLSKRPQHPLGAVQLSACTRPSY